MYRLYELINTKWIDVLDVETLMEIKTAILSESKKEEVSHFRIDHDDVPITFCGTDEFDIEGCFDTIERIDEAAMYMHKSSENYLKK